MAFRVSDTVRIILGSSSAVTGMFFLSKSSFSDLQFSDDESARATAFSLLTALFIVFLFVGPDFKKFVVAGPRVERAKHIVINSMVMSFSFVIVCALVFLIKHPRFNIHSEYSRPCINKQRDEISRRVEYNLFSFLAFAVLALIISFKRKRPSQLGFFGNLLGLIIDTSMEIKGTNGPNLRYIFGSGLFCILLIFLRCYAEMSNHSLREVIEDAREDRESRKFKILTCLEFLAAALGFAFLSLSSFYKKQFEGSTDLENAVFSVSALFLGTCLLKLPDWMDKVETACRSSCLAKATVNSLLLMIVSAMAFLNKYPRFIVHSKYKGSCTEKQRKQITHGSLFDLYSAATFSFFALVVSSALDTSAPSDQHHVELGIFSFLLQLTMDVAIETLDNEEPKAGNILASAAYCVVLILLKAWLGSRGLGSAVEVAAGGDESGQGPTSSTEGVVTHEIRDNVDPLTVRVSEQGGESEWEMVGSDGTIAGCNSDSRQTTSGEIYQISGPSRRDAATLPPRRIRMQLTKPVKGIASGDQLEASLKPSGLREKKIR